MARKQFMAEQIIIKLREAEVGLAFGAGGKFTRSQAQSAIPWKWTSKGPGSNLEGGLINLCPIFLGHLKGQSADIIIFGETKWIWHYWTAA